jgi:flagellar basal body rod protein FlgG
MESLDLLANNLANVNTRGFKADREFYTLYTGAEAEGERGPSTAPLIESSWIDHAQGVLENTGNPLDVAIDGNGMLAARGPSGVMYTRNGALRLTPAGDLVTAQGFNVLDVNNQPIRLDPRQPVQIDRGGAIMQGGQAVASLQLADVSKTPLTKERGNYFRVADGKTAVGRATAEVHQGKLENSNVGAAESSVRLVSILRQFEMLQKAISINSEMNRSTIEQVAKVS